MYLFLHLQPHCHALFPLRLFGIISLSRVQTCQQNWFQGDLRMFQRLAETSATEIPEATEGICCVCKYNTAVCSHCLESQTFRLIYRRCLGHLQNQEALWVLFNVTCLLIPQMSVRFSVRESLPVWQLDLQVKTQRSFCCCNTFNRAELQSCRDGLSPAFGTDRFLCISLIISLVISKSL